ncbi:MAG: acyltransferase [Bacteroidaceae bacterium]|nr:acyltransferase [Bacteroidaceae bacterium]
MTTQRIPFLDYLRVLACLMVILVHACEFYFINGTQIGIRSLSDGFWVSLIDSAFRCSVPLFVMISAWLLVPVRIPSADFFRRRLSRVLVPFALWSVLYAVLPLLWGGSPGDTRTALRHLALNFNDASGHLWFVYMLIGLYLAMPVLSPWLEKAGRRAERWFLILWFLSGFFPYLRDAWGDVYGECYWNEYHTLWYFSGFIGYVVLAHYLRNHVKASSKKQALLGAALYLAGYAFTATFWYGRITTAETLQQLELSWRFCTPNVILETAGAFLLVQSIYNRRRETAPLIREISVLSYGIYLMHIFVLNAMHSLLAPLFSGEYATPLTILSSGIATFAACCVVAKVLSWLPGSKYIIG